MVSRLLFVLIIVVLLCVPALTRTVQRLDPVAPSPQAVGLSRNCETPPPRVQLAGPQSTVDFVELLNADAALVHPERIPVFHQADAAPLPAFLVSSPPDSLRAPPALRS